MSDTVAVPSSAEEVASPSNLNSTSPSPSVDRLYRGGIWLGRLAGAIGLITLVGWQWDIPVLRSLGEPVSMNPLTAILLVLCSVVLESVARDTPRSILLARGLGILITSVAALKLLNFMGLRFTLDRLLYPQMLQAEPAYNQMAPNTAIALLLLGLKLTLLCARPRLPSNIPQILALLTAYMGFQSLVAYSFGMGGSLEFNAVIPMALNTAVALLSISIALLLLDSDRGFVRELTRDLAGGSMARRMLPFTILVPIIIGWLRLAGQQKGYYDSEVGVTMMITAMVIFLVGAVWWNARQLNRSDERAHGALSDLERVNRELESFSYSVSHDLRAPLRSIAGFSNILLEDHSASINAEAASHLKRIANASERMGRLIDGLLDLSRISRKAVRNEPVDLSRLAESALSDLRAGNPERQVTAMIQPGVVAEGDPDLLQIVIQNLIGNAWKFTTKQAQPRIEFGTFLTQQGRSYYVRDNGAGFDMQHARNLFGAFQRLHTGAEFEGTGIGLATVQRIIHRHGGTIWAEAEPTKGATLYFTLRN